MQNQPIVLCNNQRFPYVSSHFNSQLTIDMLFAIKNFNITWSVWSVREIAVITLVSCGEHFIHVCQS